MADLLALPIAFIKLRRRLPAEIVKRRSHGEFTAVLIHNGEIHRAARGMQRREQGILARRIDKFARLQKQFLLTKRWLLGGKFGGIAIENRLLQAHWPPNIPEFKTPARGQGAARL